MEIIWSLRKDYKITNSKQQLMSPELDTISKIYHCDFDNQGNVTLKVRRNRLVKREKNYQWQGCVHDDLKIKDGKFTYSDIVVTHRKTMVLLIQIEI